MVEKQFSAIRDRRQIHYRFVLL